MPQSYARDPRPAAGRASEAGRKNCTSERDGRDAKQPTRRRHSVGSAGRRWLDIAGGREMDSDEPSFAGQVDIHRKPGVQDLGLELFLIQSRGGSAKNAIPRPRQPRSVHQKRRQSWPEFWGREAISKRTVGAKNYCECPRPNRPDSKGRVSLLKDI